MELTKHKSRHKDKHVDLHHWSFIFHPNNLAVVIQNGPHRLKYLNAWFLVGGLFRNYSEIWICWRSMPLGWWGWPLGFSERPKLTQYSSFPPSGYKLSNTVTASCLPATGHANFPDDHKLTLWNYKQALS